MIALRQIIPILILLLIAYNAVKMGAPVRTEPMPPAWVPVVRDAAPKKSPKPAKVIVEGAALTGSIEIEDAYDLGDPLYMSLQAENTGEVSLTNVILYLALPQGTHTVQGARFMRFSIKELEPGKSFSKKGTLVQQIAGRLTLQPRFVSDQTAESRFTQNVQISTAVLTIEPNFEEAQLEAGLRELCFTVTNHGGAPARDVIVRLHDLSEEYLFWQSVESGASVEACFDLSALAAGEYGLTAEASAFAADIAYYTSELVAE